MNAPEKVILTSSGHVYDADGVGEATHMLYTVADHKAMRAAAQRLDDLMRRCREDHHELTYQDLLTVRGAQ